MHLKILHLLQCNKVTFILWCHVRLPVMHVVLFLKPIKYILEMYITYAIPETGVTPKTFVLTNDTILITQFMVYTFTFKYF